jgi:hypothetical protein
MKKTAIIILIKNSGIEDSRYKHLTNEIEDYIVTYYGTKFTLVEDNYPIVGVTCEVTQQDIDIFKDKFKGVEFLAVVSDNGEAMNGNFIYC